jgi:hypothetical protein
MTVDEMLYACHCEHNPIDAVLPDRPDIFGGPSCELGDRLRCMRAEDLRGARMSVAGGASELSCLALLAQDNAESLAARYRECSVVSCPPDSMISSDCACRPVGAAGAPPPPPAARPCEIRCPIGTSPTPACTCAPDAGEGPGLEGPGLPCPPGVPPEACIGAPGSGGAPGIPPGGSR